jgi:hypothetical protein
VYSVTLPDCRYLSHREDIDPVGSVMRAVGVAPAQVTLSGLPLSVQGSLVVARYNDRKKVIEVRGAVSAVPEYVLVHELTHVLQDQRFGLRHDASRFDAILAYRSLIEGDAVRVESAFLDERPLSGSELSKDDDLQNDVDARLTKDIATERNSNESVSLLLDLARFPYDDGRHFVEGLLSRGGQTSLDDAFLRPPQSTAEVLHGGRRSPVPRSSEPATSAEHLRYYNERPLALGGFYWREALRAHGLDAEIDALLGSLAGESLFVYQRRSNDVCFEDRISFRGPSADKGRLAVVHVFRDKLGRPVKDLPDGSIFVTACDPYIPTGRPTFLGTDAPDVFPLPTDLPSATGGA